MAKGKQEKLFIKDEDTFEEDLDRMQRQGGGVFVARAYKKPKSRSKY